MENEIKFLCRFHLLVSVAGTVVKISERKVKYHLGGSDFEILQKI